MIPRIGVPSSAIRPTQCASGCTMRACGTLVPALAIGTYGSIHHCAGGRHACKISRRRAVPPLPRRPAPDRGSLGGRGTSRRSSESTKTEKQATSRRTSPRTSKPKDKPRKRSPKDKPEDKPRTSRRRRSTPSPSTTSRGATSSSGSPTSRAWPSPAASSRPAPSPSPRPRGRNTRSRKSLTSSTSRCWPTRNRRSTSWSARRRPSPSSRPTRRSPRTRSANVDIADLPNFGRTEVVRVDVRLKNAQCEEIAPVLQKMMSPFGDAIAIEPVNQTRPDRHRRQPAGSAEDDQAHRGRRRRRPEADAPVRLHQGARGGAYPQGVDRREDRAAAGQQPVRRRRFGGNRAVSVSAATPSGAVPTPSAMQAATPAKRRVAITSDENYNIVFVTGPADKIALAKQFLTDHGGAGPRSKAPRPFRRCRRR